ncbi:MAG: DUF2520 domain-containing protein [Bdellovibrionaceae bacterium]|nr:DUF2520 domain-containing protein [Pseudobdellovibrionaceae bacterium]NUM58895.1 DUF2520 domain-containing protein [Pseudobdellovibrionaceae bacterium]
MKTKSKDLLLVGDGKLATHLKRYFHLLDIPCSQVSRSKHSTAQISEKIKKAKIILLAISDRAIESFYKEFYLTGVSYGQFWVHFSGALTVHGVIACHPLMSFSTRLLTLNEYKKIHFVVSASSNRLNVFQKLNLRNIKTMSGLIPGLKNTASYLSDQKKSLYHAHCVMAGNFPVILWSQALKEFRKMKVPEDAFLFYLQKNLENFLSLKEMALTGPLQRKDKVTIQKNISALGKNSPGAKLYKAFVKFKGL